VGVLGRVGSGKSGLLSAIIGDMRKAEGEVTLFGNVAYAAQNPWWVTNMEISGMCTHRRTGFCLRRFGKTSFSRMSMMRCFIILSLKVCTIQSHETWLTFLYTACALKPDLELLPQGDLTEVGEKGSSVHFVSHI
jgi:ABC-type cobalamin/Fe3+-siderophores transport system ATPase subunit